MSEAASFERQLPQQAEQFQVGIPRGLRIHVSPRVAGQARTHGKKEKVPVRMYAIKVEPGRPKKAKELLREQLRPVGDDDWYQPQKRHDQLPVLQLHAVMPGGSSEFTPAPPTESALDRSHFRRERVRRFCDYRTFPALVNRRLLPPWPQDGSTGQSLTKLDHKERIILPTVSMTCKKQVKKTGAEAAKAWRRGNSSQAQQLISNRGPALFATLYDHSSCQEYQADRYHGDSFVLPSLRSPVQAVNDSSRETLENEIALYRGRGRDYINTERVLYGMKRDTYLKDREAERLGRLGGCASPFDAHCRRLDLEELERQKNFVAMPEEQPKITSLMDGVSIGFSRFRATSSCDD